MFPQDQSSLLGAIQAYYNMLQQQQANQQGLGLNPQIQALQNQGNLNIAQAGQGILSQPTAPVSNMTYDPNNIQALKAQALIAQGPQAFLPAANTTPFGRMPPSATPGMMQAAIRDQGRAIDNANFWANSSFYGGGLKQLDPEEMQAAQDAATVAHNTAGGSLLNAAQQQQGVNPALLAQYGGLATEALKSQNLLGGEKYKADSTANTQALTNQAEIQKAKIMAKAQTDAAGITAGNKPPTALEQKAQEKADEASLALTHANDVAHTFDPSLYLNATQWKAKAGDALERMNINTNLKPANYDAHFQALADMRNNYLKGFGARAMTQAQTRDYINEAQATAEKDPSTAASNLRDQIARLHLQVYYANDAAKKAAERGGYYGRNNPANVAKLKALVEGAPKDVMDKVRKEVEAEFPNLAKAIHNKAGTTVNSQPYTQGSDAYNADVAAAQAAGYKLGPDGKWSK